jgi:hypothetical protein
MVIKKHLFDRFADGQRQKFLAPKNQRGQFDVLIYASFSLVELVD